YLSTRFVFQSFPVLFLRFRHFRHLPSFPTRRSSDLRRFLGNGDVVHVALAEARGSDAHELRVALQVPDRRRPAIAHARDAKLVRSEEHTSELQSPDHLVCRLLLEKKKYDSTCIGRSC